VVLEELLLVVLEELLLVVLEEVVVVVVPPAPPPPVLWVVVVVPPPPELKLVVVVVPPPPVLWVVVELSLLVVEWLVVPVVVGPCPPVPVSGAVLNALPQPQAAVSAAKPSATRPSVARLGERAPRQIEAFPRRAPSIRAMAQS
jgi:hypothetical protein